MPSLDNCTQSWFKYLDEFVYNLDPAIVEKDLRQKARKNVEGMMSQDDSIFNEAHDAFVDILDEFELMEEYELARKIVQDH